MANENGTTPSPPNFLLGYGERLVEPVSLPPGGGGERNDFAYSFEDARKTLAPQVSAMSQELEALPALACPRDQAVAVLTLHPQFLAKSYFPAALLREVGLNLVGSRPKDVKPRKWNRKDPPKGAAPSTELFVSGPRDVIRSWATDLPTWSGKTKGLQKEIGRIEEVRAQRAIDRVQPAGLDEEDEELWLEVGLHASSSRTDRFVLEAFSEYADGLDVELKDGKRVFAGRLCFMPAIGTKGAVAELAKFSFLRVVRAMPRLRRLGSVTRGAPGTFEVVLPDADPVDSSFRVAVLDGGTPDDTGLERWVTPYDAPEVGSAVSELQRHGAWVNSASLFGPLSKGELPRPYAGVDHFRVLDEHSGTDENISDLYDVMGRVRTIIESNNHSLFNLSFGPELPITDTEVHPWTCMLDELQADGRRLVTVAAGNGGENDADPYTQHNRVQVPADTVNGLCVGAADTRGSSWKRASYSSVGPGRSPGVVKPDVLFFGGSDESPFYVTNPVNPQQVVGISGTSFAAPSVMRLVSGIRAHFGERLSLLAVRSLLIHCTQGNREGRVEHGWGRIPEELEAYVVCSEGTARIVYQGEVGPGEWVRARVPLPPEELQGRVQLRATFCYSSNTEPQHPSNYTQSGLDVLFRPHDEKFRKEDDEHPKPRPFFRNKDYPQPEQELRSNAHKWETVLHHEERMVGSSLKNPMFDVKYQTREEGHATSVDEKLRYALVITVTAHSELDLYNRIRRHFRILQPLEPAIQIPIRPRQ